MLLGGSGGQAGSEGGRPGSCEFSGEVAASGYGHEQGFAGSFDERAGSGVPVQVGGVYAAGHVPGAVSIPLGELAERLDELPDTEVVPPASPGSPAPTPHPGCSPRPGPTSTGLGIGNVELIEADAGRLPLDDDAADAAVANMVLHHAPDPAAMLAEMARVVRPGGSVAITDMLAHPHEWMRTEQADIWLGFDHDQLAAWFAGAGLVEFDHAPLGTA